MAKLDMEWKIRDNIGIIHYNTKIMQGTRPIKLLGIVSARTEEGQQVANTLFNTFYNKELDSPTNIPLFGGINCRMVPFPPPPDRKLFKEFMTSAIQKTKTLRKDTITKEIGLIQQDLDPEFQDAFVATGGIAHLRGIIPSFTKHVATGKPTAWLVFKAMNEVLVRDNNFYENQVFKFSPYLKPEEEEVQFTGVVLAPEGEISKEAKIAAVKSVAAMELYNEDDFEEGCIAVENGRGGERSVGVIPWPWGGPRGVKYRTNGISEARQKKYDNPAAAWAWIEAITGVSDETALREFHKTIPLDRTNLTNKSPHLCINPFPNRRKHQFTYTEHDDPEMFLARSYITPGHPNYKKNLKTSESTSPPNHQANTDSPQDTQATNLEDDEDQTFNYSQQDIETPNMGSLSVSDEEKDQNDNIESIESVTALASVTKKRKTESTYTSAISLVNKNHFGILLNVSPIISVKDIRNRLHGSFDLDDISQMSYCSCGEWPTAMLIMSPKEEVANIIYAKFSNREMYGEKTWAFKLTPPYYDQLKKRTTYPHVEALANTEIVIYAKRHCPETLYPQLVRILTTATTPSEIGRCFFELPINCDGTDSNS